MESLMKPVALTQDVTRVLEEIRAGAENTLYCAEPGKSEALFAKHVASLIEGAGLPVLETMHYRWFLRELARLWRTRTGLDLAFHLELCIRKWVGLGLEPRTLQFLVCEAHDRLKAANLKRPRPPITPITEDSRASSSTSASTSTSTSPRNLCKSVESADDTPSPAPADVQSGAVDEERCTKNELTPSGDGS